MKIRSAAGISVLLALLIGCGTAPPAPDRSPTPAPADTTPALPAEPAPTPSPEPAPPPKAQPAPTPLSEVPSTSMEPQHVRLQHILVGFQGTVPGKNITRSREEAQTLASQLLDRALKGEDFDALVKKYTDDQYPGVYALANRMVTPNPGEFARERMIPAFGDVGFPLQIGEVGMAQYEPARSPYGWHIIKRVS